MATVNKLTAMQVAKLAEPGFYSDGEGLYLRVDTGKRWAFVYFIGGKRKEMGLGPVSDVSLAQARDLKRDARALVRDGKDPIQERRKAKGEATTFGAFAEAIIDDWEKAWTNPKHRQQWRNTLSTYAKGFWSLPIDQVDTHHIEGALKPIWLSKPETARRFRSRVERVLDAAKAKGLRTGDNPARWDDHLKATMPGKKREPKRHHAAMPFAEVPALMTRLREADGLAARALEFTILTAGRTSEVLEAKWPEFDFEARIWTVPAERMKMRAQHRVPLSDRACEVLGELKPLGGEYVFPGQKAGRPLSNMAMQMLLRRLGVPVTPHGFRSSFRDWAGEITDYPREIAEAALAHKVGSEVERAYRRGDALEKRRLMMAQWAEYVQIGPH